jgi:predicted TIM-barrel fold metal-dependent hydrolase
MKKAPLLKSGGRWDVIDAQIHIWTSVYPGGTPHRVGGFAAEAALVEMNECRVDRAVLIAPTWASDNEVMRAISQHPTRFGAMVRLTLDPEEDGRLLRLAADNPGILGARIALHNEERKRALVNGDLEWLWTYAEDHDLVLMIYPPESLTELRRIAGSRPGLRLIIDHFAVPLGASESALYEVAAQLLDFAALPNVAIKASGLQCHTSSRFPFTPLHDAVYQVIDAFGKERVFWGSDLTRLRCPYRESVEMMRTALDRLSDDGREWLLGRGLATWLRWSLDR